MLMKDANTPPGQHTSQHIPLSTAHLTLQIVDFLPAREEEWLNLQVFFQYDELARYVLM
jgi:hypothetical protein